MQDLSAVMPTYHSLVENIQNMLNDLDELEERVLNIQKRNDHHSKISSF